MANANPTRSGQINGAGDALALMLKVYSGETLAAFDRDTLFKDKHTTRSIPFGKSAQFPASGLITGYLHTPGDEITGNRMNANEKVINIEGLYVVPSFVANVDDWMEHWDYRGELAHQTGQAMAKKYDRDTARTMIMAARQTTPLVNGVYGGDSLTSTFTNASYATDGSVIFGGVYDAGVLLDSRDVPTQDRNAFFRPIQYALLLRSEKPIDRRFNNGTDNGGYNTGDIHTIDGMQIWKTNNLVGTDDRTDADQPASRQHDYSVTQGLIAHKSAAATVALKDMTTESEYDIRRQGWLMVGKYMVGKDWLRPESAVELQSAAPGG